MTQKERQGSCVEKGCVLHTVIPAGEITGLLADSIEKLLKTN